MRAAQGSTGEQPRKRVSEFHEILKIDSPEPFLDGMPEELQTLWTVLCDMHPSEVAKHRLESLRKGMARDKELEPVETKRAHAALPTGSQQQEAPALQGNVGGKRP